MISNNKIFIAGHNGMVGSSIVRLLKKKKFKKILTKNKDDLNLLDQKKVFNFLNKVKPYNLIIAAAKVGGIQVNNSRKSEFIYENIQIQSNLIHGAYKAGVKNLIFLGSSCIYPNNFLVPIKEKDLLSGPLETTNDAYAIAKIAGLKMCQYYSENYNLNYKTLMPTNLYGPNDNYDLKTSHFLPALIKKIYLAKKKKYKKIIIWGNGRPLREIMFVDDLAHACLFFMEKRIKDNYLNIGTNFEKTIFQYANIIMKYFDVKLKIEFDFSKPNGTFRKKLNIHKAKKYGWKPQFSFSKGLDITIKSYLKSINNH